jgi:hypothetical protein
MNVRLTALPAGLGRLRNLEELRRLGCPGLAALDDLQEREGLPALLAHLAAQGLQQLEPDRAAGAGAGFCRRGRGSTCSSLGGE